MSEKVSGLLTNIKHTPSVITSGSRLREQTCVCLVEDRGSGSLGLADADWHLKDGYLQGKNGDTDVENGLMDTAG